MKIYAVVGGLALLCGCATTHATSPMGPFHAAPIGMDPPRVVVDVDERGKIIGHVEDPREFVPLEGAVVELERFDGRTVMASVETDAFGRFVFDGLAPGNYSVNVPSELAMWRKVRVKDNAQEVFITPDWTDVIRCPLIRWQPDLDMSLLWLSDEESRLLGQPPSWRYL
jgi:hypothetical protein